MNLFGIGMPEMGVIFLVAFLVLGPSRSISLARTAGKLLGDLKRTFSEIAAAANLEDWEQTNPAPTEKDSGQSNPANLEKKEPDPEQVSPVDHFDPLATPDTPAEPPFEPPASRAGDE